MDLAAETAHELLEAVMVGWPDYVDGSVELDDDNDDHFIQIEESVSARVQIWTWPYGAMGPPRVISPSLDFAYYSEEIEDGEFENELMFINCPTEMDWDDSIQLKILMNGSNAFGPLR